MRYFGGVDVGSTQTKAIIIDENRAVVGRALQDMETSMKTVAQDAFDAALADAGIRADQVVRVAGTGYGRYNVSFEDVRSVLMPCLRHRIILNFEGQAEGLSTDLVIKKVIDATPEAAAV